MDIFSFFTLFGGLAFFIYGMNQMSQSLEKIAGGRMEEIVNRMTSNRFKGLFLGCAITIAIQSSSAVTVMLVGLVNSGILQIANTVGVIMGSNIGTTATAWIMSLVGISSDNTVVRMFKPESFSPVMAFIGIILIMIARSTKKKDVGNILVGFAVLMYGMMLMSGSVSPLADSPSFKSLLTAFNNPLLGVLAGLVVTAVIQSSAASVGMLQALSMTGGITFGMAIPIIMGQNIGTCATAIISSIGVNRNAKRVAVIHISFNIIGTVVFMIIFYGLHSILDFEFLANRINPVGIAVCHSIFNLATTAMLLPFSNLLVKIAVKAVKTEPERKIAFLDDRLFSTPSIAVAECNRLSFEMAEKARESITLAIENINGYSEEKSKQVDQIEKDVDVYEDRLGSYLVRLSGNELSTSDNNQISKILHCLGNFERISDHALNLVESAQELSGKGLHLSEPAKKELDTMESAVQEIVNITIDSYINTDPVKASDVEPLEQVIDYLTETIRLNHIERLQTGECTIQTGFVLADMLGNYERVSDHCSNIAVAIMELDSGSFDSHEFLNNIKTMDNPEFRDKFNGFKKKYEI